MTQAQKQWLSENPGYQAIGRPRPGVKFQDAGTLYADGTFEPMAPMKPIRMEQGCFGVGKPVEVPQ